MAASIAGLLSSEAASRFEVTGDELEESAEDEADEADDDTQIPERTLDVHATRAVRAERGRVAAIRARIAEKQSELRRSARFERPHARGTLLLAVFVVVFLYVGYLFLDAATRGHFTWRLRLVCVAAVVAMLLAFFVAD